MSREYLIDHAKANVWCVPDQDFQTIFKLHKLSPLRGWVGKLKVEWQQIALPDATSNWHVYQIGDIHPSFLGLIPKLGRWISAAGHCTNQSLIIDTYTNMGINLPRFETYLFSTYNRNLIVAIKDQGDTGVNLDVEALFMRFYTNAFFQSKRSALIPKIPDVQIQRVNVNDWHSSTYGQGPGIGGDVLVEGRRLRTRAELLAFQLRYTNLKALEFGHIYAFYNGRLVNDFNQQWFTPARFVENDWAELVFDTSIKRVVDFEVSKLDTFDSILDKTHKYLLHEFDYKGDNIDYRNDIDVFLINPIGTYAEGERFEGVYFHRNVDQSLRQVTHQDYTIPVPFVMGYKNAVPSMQEPNKWKVRLHIRHGGFKRNLILEHSRIKDLYTLPAADRKLAFLGINSTLSFWRADTLENSYYTQIMDSPKGELSLGVVQEAYGYNAIAKLTADSPVKAVNQGGVMVVDLPKGLQRKATLYEYDATGRLLGWAYSESNTKYACRQPGAAFVEGRVGTGGNYLSTHYGVEPLTLDPDVDYAFYKCALKNGLPNYDWRMADPEDYSVINGVAHWNVSSGTWYTCIRNNNHFLNYAIDNRAIDGLLIFSLQANEDEPKAPANRVLELRPSKIDVFLNGYPLVYRVDYIRIGSQFVVYNKRYLIDGEFQRLVVRATGLPFIDADGKQRHEEPIDTGFVVHGQLSRNKRYDIRDDKVLRMVVGGGVRLPESLSFPETGGPRLVGIKNGDPYSIEEVIVPIKAFTTKSSYVMREASVERDKAVSDYLTQKIPEPVEPNPNPMDERYEIYSPFVAKIAHDLKEGHLVVNGLDKEYTDAQMEVWLKNYLYLLDYDPTRQNLDEAFVIIHPHDLYEVMELSVWQHHFVRRVINRWMKNKVPAAQFFKIADDFVPVTPMP